MFTKDNKKCFFKKESSVKTGFISNLKEILVLILIVFLVRTFGFGLYQVPTGSMETTMLVGERFFADKFTILFSKINRSDIVAFNDPSFNYSDNIFKRFFQEYIWGPVNWTKRVIGLPGDHVMGVIENGKPEIYINGTKIEEPYVNKYPLISVFRSDINSADIMSMEMGILDGRRVVQKSYDRSLPSDKQKFYRVNRDRIYINKLSGQPYWLDPGAPIRKDDNDASVVIRGRDYWNNGDEFSIKLDKDEYWLMGDNRQGSYDSRVVGPISSRLIHGRIIFRIWSIDSDENWWIVDFFKNPIDYIKRIRFDRFFQFIK